jgi:hypothetical protein
MPFCYAEAAANLLTNPALDPAGKIPEFKFCACRVTPLPPAEHEEEETAVLAHGDEPAQVTAGGAPRSWWARLGWPF